MEQKAKRIGKFNVVDVIAVALIIAVVALVGYKLLGGSGETMAQEMIPLTYQVQVENVPTELYESCLTQIPSPMMASGKLVGGEIVAVEKQPYLVLGPDGEWVEDPNHVTLIFTAQTEVVKEDVLLNKLGEQEIRIGKTHILKSEYIEFSEGQIISVQWEE